MKRLTKSDTAERTIRCGYESSGSLATGWRQVNRKWYYIDSSGAMVTGWKFIDNNWFYFDTSGAMASNQWIEDNYVNSSGYWTKAKVSTNGNFKQAVETEGVTCNRSMEQESGRMKHGKLERKDEKR